ncbi:hypothetical protein [Methanobacterium sp. SMA-27]|uniref:hypothetical protein n=1 Tax=Methanobacterium sp. SMA-27 TaxID=1495336 RepID=UPI00064EE338|nr:hypothetical protein [Methanobacterium sp. SMA-27]
MRISEGIPNGRIAELSHPEMFQEHEEVIVFTRNEFNRFYTSMMEQINYINKIDLYLDRSEDWKLLGYWPKILQRVHLLDMNIDSILTKEASLQCYLDASLYNTVQSSKKNVSVAKKKIPIQQTLPI